MKSIVMTAQDARELDKLGGLTIAKPIKPAPAHIEGARLVTHAPGQWLLVGPDGDRLGAENAGDFYTPPVHTGDAVFIREPWHRLTNPANGEPSDRVILASDTDAEPVAYKWASPVSMPEDAARRFARVSSVTPIYNENVTAWEITLEKIDKAEAVAVDALEDAHVPAENHLPPAEEIRKKAAILNDVQDERRVLAALIADPAALEDMPPEEIIEAQECRIKKAEALVEEERALTAYLDAIRAGEPPAATTEPTTDPGEAPAAEGDTEEDEESGSFTLGKCTFCGREWGVTLEGAKNGGYPTQRTANAAATRACDCDHGTIEVVAPIGNEATKAAAIAWGVDWESLKFTSRFIRLGEAEE